MSKPTPVLRRGRWTLDLRWAGCGQRFLTTPGRPELEVEALHEAYRLFMRLRAERAAAAAQVSLLEGPSVRQVAEQLLDEREYAVSPDFGSYWRTNRKSAAVIPGAAFDCPEQLWIDVKEETARLGRPWHEGERICGGRWAEGSRILKATATRLGLPLPINFRSVLRRSTVYELAIRGWSERECADVLGHVDEHMIRTVYRRVPLRNRSPHRIPWDIASSRKMLGGVPWTFRAKVLELERRPPHRADAGAGLVGPELLEEEA